jgi:hypothetical protein
MIKGFGNILYLFEMETEILCSSVYTLAEMEIGTPIRGA